jgi:hypothetical protein
MTKKIKESVDKIKEECDSIEEEIKPKKAKTFGDPVAVVEY